MPPRMSSHCYKLFDLFPFDFSHKTVVFQRRTLYCCHKISGEDVTSLSYYYYYSQPIKSNLVKLKLCPVWNILFISWCCIRVHYFNISTFNSTGKKSRCLSLLFFSQAKYFSNISIRNTFKIDICQTLLHLIIAIIIAIGNDTIVFWQR